MKNVYSCNCNEATLQSTEKQLCFTANEIRNLIKVTPDHWHLVQSPQLLAYFIQAQAGYGQLHS